MLEFDGLVGDPASAALQAVGYRRYHPHPRCPRRLWYDYSR